MPEYQSQSLKFVCKGVDLAHPVDLMPDGKFPILQNIRVTKEGIATTREGVSELTASGAGTAVHSLSRLNGLSTSTRIVGAGTHVWTGNAALVDQDSGYDGKPLSIVDFRPDQSVEAFAYIASSSRMRKFRPDGTNYQVGILPPLSAPSAALAAPNYAMLQNCEATAGWTQTGTAAAPTLQSRINDTILVIKYDTGTTGWADIIPSLGVDYTFQPGAEILVNAEQALIYEAYEKIDDSTIASIIYDSGTSGLCWVVVTQPNIGIKVNSLVGLGAGGEWVRALDVVTNKQGVISFRCSTVSTRAAGNSVIGTTSFRIYLVGTHAAAGTLVGHGVQTQITQGTGNLTKAITANLQLINGRAVEVDDYIHVSVAFDKPYLVSKLTIEIDVSDASFTKDYYYKEFSSVDLDPGYAHWTELKFKIAEMVRVGNSKGATLKTVASLQATVEATDTLFLTLDSWWGGGTYGADVGSTGAPVQYATRFRSTSTGSKSNPSPATRTGIPAKRERVAVSLPVSVDPQVTHVDLFRFGAGEDNWRLAGTYVNGTTTANDDQTTTTLLVAELLQFDNYLPFPVSDIPRTGVVDVSGCMIKYVSGSQFNTFLVPGTQIILNGGVYTLRSSPISSGMVEIEESAGALSGVAYSIPEGTIAGEPLPSIWRFGGQGTGTFLMGCGDQFNPGFLRWCKGNDADAASDTGNLEITSPSEPLMMGFEYDGRAYVFSTERLFALFPNFQDPSLFTSQVVLSGNGLYARYSLCVTPFGPAWIGKDGIYMWAGGKPQCLTDELYPLFPHNGVAGESVQIFDPPDFTLPNSLRLFYADNSLYFIYATLTGHGIMRYDIKHQGWFPYQFSQDMRVVLWEDGLGVSDVLFGAADGKLYTQSATSNGDSGTDISCQIRTQSYNNGNTRAEKIYGDQVLTLDTKGLTVSVQTKGNNGTNSVIPATTTAITPRTSINLDISTTASGRSAINICLDLSWAGKDSPEIYEWLISFLIRPEVTNKRPTDYTDDGKSTAKQLRGCIIQADTGSLDRTIKVIGDGGVVVDTLTVNHDGQIEIPYGITPAITHMMKLLPTDANTWKLYGVVWIWDDWAELAQIVTPYTNGGYNGPKYVRGVEMSADSDGVDQNLFIQFEGGGSGATLAINHIGNQTKPYSFTPFFAYLLRVVPGGPVRIFNDQVKWIFDPYPDNTDMLGAWDDGGYMGDKYVRGARLKADTDASPVTIDIQKEGSVVVTSIVATHNGQSNFPYAFVPFIARNLRLAPKGNARIFAVEWEYDKYPDLTTLVTPWEDGGAPGAKFVQGMRLRADTENAVGTIGVQGDSTSQLLLTSVQHDGQVRKPYSWTPFIAHTMRIVPVMNIRIFDIEWVYNPLPELATNWITQGTTHDLEGYLHSPYARIAHISTADFTFTVIVDGVSYNYLIPSSNGLYVKTPVRLAPVKGMIWAYAIATSTPLRLFKRDCEVQIKQWGDSGAFKVVRPFGDNHRVTGATI